MRRAASRQIRGHVIPSLPRPYRVHGMGLVVLHSGHFSKIFRRLMGTTCDLKWREDSRRERLRLDRRKGHDQLDAKIADGVRLGRIDTGCGDDRVDRRDRRNLHRDTSTAWK